MSESSAADPRLSFNRAPDLYDEVRPHYPSSMFDDLFRRLPLRPSILEVGAGTGQATTDLLDRKAIVHAIEIGPATAAKLRDVLPSRALSVIVGDFEEVRVEEHSMDAVFSACAYHWISPRSQLDRPATILRPGGTVAIVDLTQVSSPDDHGFFAAAQPIYERYGEPHVGPPAPERDQVNPPIRASLSGDRRFSNVDLRSYDWNQTYSASDYRKLMSTYSGTQMMEPSGRDGLVDDIESFIEEHFNGQITRPLVATLTTARLVA